MMPVCWRVHAAGAVTTTVLGRRVDWGWRENRRRAGADAGCAAAGRGASYWPTPLRANPGARPHVPKNPRTLLYPTLPYHTPTFEYGRKVAVPFPDVRPEPYEGTILSFHLVTGYRVIFDDGDCGDYWISQMREYLVE